MTSAGVIPPPEERSPYVRVIGSVEDMDGSKIHVGVDYDSVTISNAIDSVFTREMAEEFAHLFVSACWAAGENKRRMDGETVPP
jgi:hypothetical protein